MRNLITPDTPFFIVLNAGSGKRDAETVEATIRGVLEQAGRRCDHARIDHPRQLPKLARRAVKLAQQQQDAVVVAGGDGTINAVAQVVLNSGLSFGVLPQGTFNYFSRAHGIPTDTATATRLLLDATVRLVQMGLINDRVFLVNAIGLYPQLLEERIGTLALLGILCRGALGRLGDADNVASFAFDRLTVWPYRRRRIKVAMDGEVTWLHTPLVFQVAPHPLPLLVPACAITTSPANAGAGVL
jgi:diacylglycerol kinase family enzyme